MQKVLIMFFSAMIVLWGTQGVLADSDWLQKGKDLLGGIGKSDVAGSVLSDQDMGAGLKEALKIGTGNVVNQLGTSGGFSDDPAIHIPLPDGFKKAQSALSKLGMGATLDDLESKINYAAEAATPKAKQLFVNSISEMTLDDVKGIFNGPDDAATRYFQNKMTPELSKEMQPIVNESLAEAGAVQAYDQVMAKYRNIPFVPDIKSNLTDYVVEKGTAGIFHYLAIEEAAIRKDPAKRTTDLLKQVFNK